MLAVLVYIFFPISGANLNPAVSLACGIAGKTSWSKVGAYCLLQITAGLLAGIASYEVFLTPLGVSPVSPFSFWDAALVELMYTCLLAFVVLSVAAARGNNPSGDQNHFFGLAIGFVVIAAGYSVGNISGAVLNPAVAFGLEVVGTKGSNALQPWGLAFAGVELLGGVLGALLFNSCRREDATNSSDPSFEPSLRSKLLSEFVGTFALTLTVGLSLAGKSGATAWAAGCVLASMVYALHDVSGAHLNPAVTAAVVLSGRGKCSFSRGLSFCAMQLFAGLMAGAVAAAFHQGGPYSSEAILLEPKSNFTWLSVFGVELAFTFLLAFVVLSVATTRLPESLSKQNFHFGLAIGSCVTAGGFAAGAVSGGLLNPAVSLSIATLGMFSGGQLEITYCLAFSLFQLAGGLLATAFFHVSHAAEYQKPRALLH